MRSYNTLTRLGRLRRMRQLAESALKDYGLGTARARFFYHAGNTLYRVYDTSFRSSPLNDDLFEPGQYLLRIYQPDWQTPQAVQLELAWLSAMRNEGRLPVPEPVPRLDGELVSHISTPGIPQGRMCALLRWVRGRQLPDFGRVEHYHALGRLMGRMHRFTQMWPIPAGSGKRCYDWNGLFMNDAEIGLPPGKSWEYLPPDWVEPFRVVARRFRRLVAEWGMGGDVYGLIHADLGVDANVLFWHGQPRPIDFDGSGFGYWMYDVAVALAHLAGSTDYYRYRDALLEGYSGQRSLPAAQLEQLDLFTAAFFVYYDLWVVGGTHLHPEYLNRKMEQTMVQGATFVIRYVEGIS